MLNNDLASISKFKLDTISFNENNIVQKKNLLIGEIEAQKNNGIEKKGIVIPISESNYNSLIAVFDVILQCDLDELFLENDNLYIFPLEKPFQIAYMESMYINREELWSIND